MAKLNRGRTLRVTRDFQNSMNPITYTIQIYEARRVRQGDGTISETDVLVDTIRTPRPHYQRILRHHLSKFRVSLENVELVNENDGRLLEDQNDGEDPYGWL